MKLKTILCDYDKIKLELYNYFSNAKKSIYINSWLIDTKVEIYENIKIYQLLNEKHNEGVKVTLTMFNNPLFHINNNDVCEFEYITTNTIGKPILPFLSNNISEFFNISQQSIHQKYILIDEQYLFLNGADNDDTRSGSFTKNIPNKYDYIWYETCVILEIDKMLANTLIAYYYNEEKIFHSLLYTTNKNTLFTTSLQDCQCKIKSCFCKNIQLINNKKLIDQAKESIYIENQYFDYSYNNNDFIDHLIYLLIKKPKLTVTVLTNIEFNDLTQQFIMDCLSYCIYFTLKKLKAKLEKFDLLDRFKIKYLHKVFVHSKIMIIDKDIAQITTSNLSDRSLLNNCDLEMSLIIENKEEVNKVIKHLEETYNTTYDILKTGNYNEFLNAFYLLDDSTKKDMIGTLKYFSWLHKLNDNRLML